jgi:hypothetical protein
MASYREAVSLQNRRMEQAESEDPGILKSGLRGVAASPGYTMSVIESLRNMGLGRELPRYGEHTEDWMVEKTGIPEPTGYWPKVAERTGKQAIPILAGAPLGGMAAGGLGVGGEIVLGTLATAAAEAVAESGGSPAAQMGTGIAAGVLAPATIPGRLMGATAKRIPGIGKRLASSAARAGTGLPDEVAMGIARKYGIDVAEVQRAASELKRRVGDTRAIDRATTKLDDERLFAGLPETSQPTSRAYMGRDAAQNISSMEEGLARGDLDFSASVGNRKANALEDVADRFGSERPGGSIETLRAGYDDALKAAIKEQQDAWANVPLDEMEMISTERLKAAARESASRAGEDFPDRIPKETQAVLDWPDSVTPERFQRLRSQALLTKRVAARGGEQAQYYSNNLDPLIDGLNRELDDLTSEGSAAYRNALGLTRRNKELFDPKSPAVKALSGEERARTAMNKIRLTPTEAKRAVEIAERQPGGLDALRRTAIDDLFGVNFGDVTPRKIRTLLKENRTAYKTILGDKILENMEVAVDELDVLLTGRAGTPAASAATGTGITPLGIAFGAANMVRHPVEAVGKAFNAVNSRMVRDISTHPERSAILREALLDRKLMSTLLKMPDEAAVPAWIVNWDKLVARAKARRVGSAEAAARAGAREATSNDTSGIPLTLE